MDLDEFSDDGLDDLGVTELDALEAHAIQLTQAKQQLPSQQTQNAKQEYSWDDDDDFDTTEVTNDVGQPVGRHPLHPTASQQPDSGSRRMLPPVPNPQWNPAFNGTGRQASQALPGGLGRPPQSQFARALIPNASQSGDVVGALQQRLRALETELSAARGEASILRAKSNKSQRDFDVQVTQLKKINAEQQERHERLMEAAVAAEKSANTELQFMQRDMREKAISEKAKKRETSFGSTVTTPKKAGGRTWGIADGFDEMDIAISPSKGQGRGKMTGSVATAVGERTPSKGKRKRAIIDSPVMALETHTEDVFMPDAKSSSQPATAPTQFVSNQAPAAPFEFLQLALDHGSFKGEPPTFDSLSKFTFPSEPSISIAAKIFERIPLMGNPQQPLQLLVDFVEFMATLWLRCFEEQYWAPVRHLTDLIAFTFQLHTTSVAPLVVRNLIPTVESTVFLIAEAHQQRLADGTIPNHAAKQIEANVSTSDAMALIQLCALACSSYSPNSDRGDEYSIAALWRLLSLEFILLMLTAKQDIADVISMLNLLATSPLPDSIGPICQSRKPDFIAPLMIERVSAKLTESTRSAISPSERRQVRAAALRTLIAFAKYPFGAKQLANHDNALPRLVMCLSASIDDLYTQPISKSVLAQSGAYSANVAKLTASAQSAADLSFIIAQCVALIHTLVTGPHTAGQVDMSRKLSVAHGGNQRYVLALGRLTFAENDLIIECGIDAEVIEAAHELLELVVMPDEAEVISEAFDP